MSGAAYVQTSMADIPIVKAECRQKKESKNLSAILSMPDHPDVKRLNVVVNDNAKTLYFAFCKPCEKRLLIVACTVNSLFVGKPDFDTFALFFEISVF